MGVHIPYPIAVVDIVEDWASDTTFMSIDFLSFEYENPVIQIYFSYPEGTPISANPTPTILYLSGTDIGSQKPNAYPAGISWVSGLEPTDITLLEFNQLLSYHIFIKIQDNRLTKI